MKRLGFIQAALAVLAGTPLARFLPGREGQAPRILVASEGPLTIEELEAIVGHYQKARHAQIKRQLQYSRSKFEGERRRDTEAQLYLEEVPMLPPVNELVRQEQRHRSRTQAQMLRHMEAQFYGG